MATDAEGTDRKAASEVKPAPAPTVPPAPPSPPRAEDDEPAGPKVGVLVGLVVLVTLGAGLTWQLGQEPPPPPPPAAIVVDTLPIVVAARDLFPGEVLAPADLMAVEVRATDVPAENVFASPDGLGERLVRERIGRGEVVFAQRLAEQGAPLVIDSLLRPGRTLTTIVISTQEAGVGVSLPGDVVDILAAVAADGSPDRVQGLQVLSIGGEFDRGTVIERRSELLDAQGREAIGLSTTPDEAALIGAFAQAGGLKLVPRTQHYVAPDDPTGGKHLFVSQSPGGYLRLMQEK
jgi:Flp pilus assembly protein CpaB